MLEAGAAAGRAGAGNSDAAATVAGRGWVAGVAGCFRSITVRALPDVMPSCTTRSASDPDTSLGGNPALSCMLAETTSRSKAGIGGVQQARYELELLARDIAIEDW